MGHAMTRPAPARRLLVRMAAVALLTAALALASTGLGAAPAHAQEDDAEPCPPRLVGQAPFIDHFAVPYAHLYAVDCAALHGIVLGFADEQYLPSRPVRRDQMASLVARALAAAGVDLPPPTGERFADVDPDSPHDEAIHRLAEADIIRGGPGALPTDDYGPQLRVRRDQMASFLLRAAEFATGESLADDQQRFHDVPPDNAHFANVNGAAGLSVALGVAPALYRPAADTRRDQMATFLTRLLERLAGVLPSTVWHLADLSHLDAVGEDAAHASPAEGVEAIVAELDFDDAAEVWYGIAEWSDSATPWGVIEIREVPDDSVYGEDYVMQFLQSVDQGTWSTTIVQRRSYCRRTLDQENPTLCV